MNLRGWAVTLLGSRKWGDGYVQGTDFNAYTWFANISKRINDRHQLSLTAFGSPQTHNKRTFANGLSILGWQSVKNYMDGESMYRYNPTFGYDNDGRVRSSSFNFYHKPQISLNHIWQINDRSSLSSAVYCSLGQGGGYGGQGRNGYSNASWYGADKGNLTTLFRRADGTFDYGAIQDMNEASETGSNMVMSKSTNEHTWVGLVSTYKHELIENQLNLLAGVDVRYYEGRHKNVICDLYNGAYFMDDGTRGSAAMKHNPLSQDPSWVYEKLGVGDVVYRNYNGYTQQEGVYAQLEYQPFGDKLTTVLAGSVNNTAYWRVDHYYYAPDNNRSETLNFWAGNVKAGANYNIDRYNNVFVNGGYFTRAPFFQIGVFNAYATSNVANPNAVNEKCASVELGYEFHSPEFTAVLNGYYTKWLDKTAARTVEMSDGSIGYFNMTGVDARHMGVEAAATYRPNRYMEFNGMLSVGDWIWDSNATGYFYNANGQPLADLKGAIASDVYAPNHAKTILLQKGRKVGGSAQTTGALSAVFKPLPGWRVGIDWTASARNYSDFSISKNDYAAGASLKVADPWEIPWGNAFDLQASYNFKIGGLDATVFGNVYNLFNNYYIMDATCGAYENGTWQNAYQVFYSFGRTYALRLKVNF